MVYFWAESTGITSLLPVPQTHQTHPHTQNWSIHKTLALRRPTSRYFTALKAELFTRTHSPCPSFRFLFCFKRINHSTKSCRIWRKCQQTWAQTTSSERFFFPLFFGNLFPFVPSFIALGSPFFSFCFFFFFSPFWWESKPSFVILIELTVRFFFFCGLRLNPEPTTSRLSSTSRLLAAAPP